MPIGILRTEISELNEAIANWLGEIDLINSRIEDARAEIAAKEAEIEELESEAHKTQLIQQLTEALSNMTVEQLGGLVSSIQNGETPTITPAPVEDHPTVTRVNHITVSTRFGDVTIERPEDCPSSWYLDLDECYDEFGVLDYNMAASDITIVGVRHQELLGHYHYVPQIGEVVRLQKETDTSNCFAILVASETNGFDEDQVIGVLPAVGGTKADELNDRGFPCLCHQAMWNNPDLNELYEVTGVLAGQYVTIRKIGSATPAAEEETEDSSSNPSSISIDILEGLASNVEEARRIFNSHMPDTCDIQSVIENPNNFIINYIDHEENTMDAMRKIVSIVRED